MMEIRWWLAMPGNHPWAFRSATEFDMPLVTSGFFEDSIYFLLASLFLHYFITSLLLYAG